MHDGSEAAVSSSGWEEVALLKDYSLFVVWWLSVDFGTPESSRTITTLWLTSHIRSKSLHMIGTMTARLAVWFIKLFSARKNFAFVISKAQERVSIRQQQSLTVRKFSEWPENRININIYSHETFLVCFLYQLNCSAIFHLPCTTGQKYTNFWGQIFHFIIRFLSQKLSLVCGLNCAHHLHWSDL